MYIELNKYSTVINLILTDNVLNLLQKFRSYLGTVIKEFQEHEKRK